MSPLNGSPHRRRNALTGEWVLVSPHRAQRPWQGRSEVVGAEIRSAHDSQCYLCAGNLRAGGERNPEYDSTFTFENDFAALLPSSPGEAPPESPLLCSERVRGVCKVVCFSPRHDLTLARMGLPGIRAVIDTWSSETELLGCSWRWVQIFENKGDLMGCSNPHPHGQIWASDGLPNEVAKEDRCQREYFAASGNSLLRDYATLEQERRERLVIENADWLVVVPYWAVWPYETLLLPRFPVSRLPELSSSQRDTLSAALESLLTKYDNLFQTAFPYSMGWHGAPFDEKDPSPWQLHAHFYPPLLRSATVKKFMVGYELLAEAQRDLTPEAAAERLRSLPEEHYLSSQSAEVH